MQQLPGLDVAMDFEWMRDVPSAWEDNRQLRWRSIEGKGLAAGVMLPRFGKQEVILGTLDCCKLNAKLLRILLDRMAKTACIFNPPLHILQAACMEFHADNGFPDPNGLASKVGVDGWGLKRMLSFLRRKFSKPEMPRVT